MKTERETISYDGKTFDSQEELEFYWWCEEALEDRLLKAFDYHAETFELSPPAWVDVFKQMKTKVKPDKFHLLREHVYTPDFRLAFNQRLLESKLKLLKASCIQDVLMGHACETTYEVWVDVKGGFSIYHDDKSFSINVKWVWSLYRVFINKVVPKKFFAQFWLPEKARWTKKTHKQKLPYAGLRNRDGFFDA